MEFYKNYSTMVIGEINWETKMIDLISNKDYIIEKTKNGKEYLFLSHLSFIISLKMVDSKYIRDKSLNV